MNNTTSDNTQEQPSLADNIKKILNDFNTKLIFIFVSLFVLCNTFITNVIDKYIDRGILSGFNDNIAERILFIVVIALLIYYSRIATRRNKKVSNAEIEWAFTALLFWAYYRLISIGWTYVKFWNFDFIYYIDIVPLFLSLIFIKRLLYQPRKYEPEGFNGFELDIPITHDYQDSFGRKDLAQNLARKIKNTNVDKDAFSIGIESPWGFGKTSFINLLCNHLIDKNTIIIKFNPWNYEKERSLVDAFFVELRETLKKYDSSLSTTLTQYGNILSHSNHDSIKLSAEFIQCLSSQSINTKRSKIDSAIKAIGKLIIVVIDDLDRLDKDEIISVLKLIRNSANFPNMVFVSAYDREYLIETLKDEVCNSNKYLEKIFQYQFKLPEFDKSKLQEILFNEGNKFIDDIDKSDFQRVVDRRFIRTSGVHFILNYIDNARDVYRFLNSFKYAYQRLRGETIIKDLMFIELLRMKYYNVYELLSKEHEKYLVCLNNNLILWNSSLNEEPNSFVEYEDILKVITKKYSEGSNDYKQITGILKSMFNIRYLPEVIKAINNPFYIDRYFYYSLLDSDISENEFKSVMEKPYDDIKQKIKLWVDEKKTESLSTHFEHFVINANKKYDVIFKSIFYFGFLIKAWPVAFYYIQELIKKMTMIDKKEFLYGVFFENGISEFVLKYIHYISMNSGLNWQYIFSLKECCHINAKMFQLACDKDEMIRKIYDIWLYTHFAKHITDSNNVYHPEETQNEEADSFFISYIKRNYVVILPQLIGKDFNDFAFIFNNYFKIWKSKEAFISFIDELMESNIEDEMLKEFREFVTVYIKEGVPVQFDFKYIKLDS